MSEERERELHGALASLWEATVGGANLTPELGRRVRAALALHERREPAHASDCECTECWQAMEVNCK